MARLVFRAFQCEMELDYTVLLSADFCLPQ